MNEKELLTKKFILVGMDDAEISTEDRPIIGTDALATCLGVLLYSEEKKLAIVAHVSPGSIQSIDKVFNLIIKHKLTSTIFKYKIIPGYYEEHYNTKELIEKHFTHFIPFEESEFTDSAIEINEKLGFKKFAFDSSTGKFVTDKVLFGVDYFIVNSNDINNETSVSINKTR